MLNQKQRDVIIDMVSEYLVSAMDLDGLRDFVLDITINGSEGTPLAQMTDSDLLREVHSVLHPLTKEDLAIDFKALKGRDLEDFIEQYSSKYDLDDEEQEE